MLESRANGHVQLVDAPFVEGALAAAVASSAGGPIASVIEAAEGPAVSTNSETVVELPAAVDLHARPAANFVRAAMQFDADITVAADGREADAKSLLAVLALGARGGSTLRLSAEGSDADRALEDLTACIGSLE